MSSSDLRHTGASGECKSGLVQELAVGLDSYWYMTVAGYTVVDAKELQQDWHEQLARVERRLGHLLKDIEAFRALEDEVKCPACLTEIKKQIEIQTKAIDELKQKWGM